MCYSVFASRTDNEDDRYGGSIAVNIFKFGNTKSFNKCYFKNLSIVELILLR